MIADVNIGMVLNNLGPTYYRCVRDIAPFPPTPCDRRAPRYTGSLTTPPCFEGVKWIVTLGRTTIAESEVTEFIQNVGENARPVQPRNGRALYSVTVVN